MSGPGNKPAKKSWLGFRPGLELNRTELLVTSRTARWLPEPVGNNIGDHHWGIVSKHIFRCISMLLHSVIYSLSDIGYRMTFTAASHHAK
jgi:hypothetical protein